MKKLFKVALVALCIVSAGNLAKGQSKIGYINMSQLEDLMPETKVVMASLKTYNQQFVDVLTSMNNELQTKSREYEAQQGTMTDAVRSAKQSELGDLQKRLQDEQTSARQKVETKQNELGKPIVDKARGAVAAVAKEKGYSYVLDSSQIDLVVSPSGDDMMADVKLKLGLK